MKNAAYPSQYRLLAADMDGTALTADKTISPRTAAAMKKALAAGREVLFATGRCPSEMMGYLRDFPEMNYALCLSGALIFDLKSGAPLSAATISRDTAEQVLALTQGLDVMVNFYAGPDVFVEKRRQGNMAYFNCDCFAAMYDSCAVWVEDIREVLTVRGDEIYKINLYFHSLRDWEKAGELLKDLPLEYASGIPNNWELSPHGVNKGTGLVRLSEATGIPVEQMIAVGDEGNDRAMLQTAGLGVAMGNAIEEIRALADVVTADCDHDGVAQIIERYLL